MWVVPVSMESFLPTDIGFACACSSNRCGWYLCLEGRLMLLERAVHRDAAFLPTDAGNTCAYKGCFAGDGWPGGR